MQILPSFLPLSLSRSLIFGQNNTTAAVAIHGGSHDTTLVTPRRIALLEEKLRDPGSVANIDCLLDTVTALVADCDHDNVKRIKTIEAYTSRCKYIPIIDTAAVAQHNHHHHQHLAVH